MIFNSLLKALRRWGSRRAVAFAWLIAVASLPTVPMHFGVPVPWPLSLAVHFQWFYFVAGASFGLLALWGGRWRQVRTPFIVMLVGLVFMSPQLAWDKAPGAEARPVLTVATANLNYENRDFGKLERWLTSVNAPDIVVLQEFTDAAKSAVREPAIRQVYRYRALAPQSDQFGLAILSRLPFLSAERIEPATTTRTLSLRAVIDWRGTPIALGAIHPMPPINARYTEARDKAIQEEARQLAGTGMPALLVGDLNDTPWSTGLRSAAPHMAMVGGLNPTWPNVGGWLSVLPLDHVLATQHWGAADDSVGPDIGSDHRPRVVQVRLKASGTKDQDDPR